MRKKHIQSCLSIMLSLQSLLLQTCSTATRKVKREALFNENWKKNKVNINEIINKYTPNETPKIHGVKSIWKNKDYIIKADMASGYLKIYDRHFKTFLDKYGNLVPDGPDSHMKILRKEEM